MSEKLLARHLRLSRLCRHAERLWCFHEQRLTWLIFVASYPKSLHSTSGNSASTLGRSQPDRIVLKIKVLENLYHCSFAQMDELGENSATRPSQKTFETLDELGATVLLMSPTKTTKTTSTTTLIGGELVDKCLATRSRYEAMGDPVRR